MSRRPKRPLNKAAVKQANAEFYAKYPALKGKSLSATDPTQAGLRKEWMDLYIKHGGQLEPPRTTKKSGSGTSPTTSCITKCTPPPPCPPPDSWLKDALAVMCPEDTAFLDDLRSRGVTITAFDRIYFEDPYFDGSNWTTKPFEAGGSTLGGDINIVLKHTDKAGNVYDIPSENIAETIYHEGVHTGQPNSMPWREKEYDAYIRTEQWAIDHGLPGDPTFRTTDASGDVIPNEAAIKAFVDKDYPITLDKPKAPGGAVYKVVGRTGSGDSIIQNVKDRTDIKTRPAQKGDTYPGPQIEEPPGGRPAQTCQLKCP